MITNNFSRVLKKNLNFSGKINLEVYNELMKNPMSLIVANH